MGRIIFIVILASVGCVLSILLLSVAMPRIPPSYPKPLSIDKPAPPAETSQTQDAAYGSPVRLKVPKLHINAPIDPMGLTPEGDMQSPRTSQHAGWYKFGSRPGEKGSAVIAGHYGSGSNRGVSVFDELHTLSKGDEIWVEDEKGMTVTFSVREFRTYGWNEDAIEAFYSTDNKAHLNLVTCKGTWDTARQTYSHRLVLFADKK